MAAIFTAMLYTHSFCDTSFNNSITEFINILADINPSTLNKQASESLTSYSNSSYNIKYTAPSGWSFISPSTGDNGVSLHVTSPYYSPTIIIAVFNRDNEDAAYRIGPSLCFNTTSFCYKRQISKAPLVYACIDTILPDGNHYASIEIKYLDDYSIIAVTYSLHYGRYVQYLSYMTTVADYEQNKNVYLQHWNNIEWYSPTLLKNNNSSLPAHSTLSISNNNVNVQLEKQQQIKLELFNLQGQLLKNLYTGPSMGKTSYPIGNEARSNQIYILNLQADNEQKSLILKSLQ
jgi:mRNA-degrading endonuclease HigB of HigAB toxin-antitoxin module